MPELSAGCAVEHPGVPVDPVIDELLTEDRRRRCHLPMWRRVSPKHAPRVDRNCVDRLLRIPDVGGAVNDDRGKFEQASKRDAPDGSKWRVQPDAGLRLGAGRGRAVERPLKPGLIDADRPAARAAEVDLNGPRLVPARGDAHLEQTSARYA